MYSSLQADDHINATSATATSDSVFTDASSVQHVADLALDGTLGSWFGSSSQNNVSWLEVDLGTDGPYYDELSNITV
jgi:hypothetical protein